MGDWQTLLSHALIAISGFQGIPVAEKRGLQFAGAAFTISAVAGSIAIVHDFTDNETVAKINSYTSALCTTLVVPLIATQVCLNKGVRREMALLNLAYPTIHYVFRNILEDQESSVTSEYLEISQTISVATMAYFFMQDGNEFGLAMSAAYAFATLGTPELMLPLLAIGNFIYTFKILS